MTLSFTVHTLSLTRYSRTCPEPPIHFSRTLWSLPTF